MPQQDALSLLAIAAAAVAAPLLSELLRRFRVPSVLFELLLGILIGPFVLGWADVDGFVDGLSHLGVAFLFFMAGYEIEFARIRGVPLGRAGRSWTVTVVLGLAVGTVLTLEGLTLSGLLVGLALTTTAIGTLLPILRDRGVLDTRFGTMISAAGAVGEFGPILAVTLLLSGESPLHELVLLGAFVLTAVAVAAVAARPQPPRLVELLQRHLGTSTQLPVRVFVLLIVAMVAVTTAMGLDMLLGAFAAGLIARLAIREDQAVALIPRLEAVGYGFLIPVFFVVSGMEFDAPSLVSSPTVMLATVGFAALFLVVRGGPALWFYRRVLDPRRRAALAVLQSTALPILVVITQIGLESGDMRQDTATALVGAGMLSVLVFPLLAFRLLDRAGPEPEPAGGGTTGAAAEDARGARRPYHRPA